MTSSPPSCAVQARRRYGAHLHRHAQYHSKSLCFSMSKGRTIPEHPVPSPDGRHRLASAAAMCRLAAEAPPSSAAPCGEHAGTACDGASEVARATRESTHLSMRPLHKVSASRHTKRKSRNHRCADIQYLVAVARSGVILAQGDGFEYVHRFGADRKMPFVFPACAHIRFTVHRTTIYNFAAPRASPVTGNGCDGKIEHARPSEL